MTAMDKDFSIAVIIPAYNTAPWIGECLNSVVGQSRQFDEIVLINDGSTDDTESICRRYASLYDNIHLISQSNRGPSVARNVGLSNISSDYVVFLDSDDCLREDAAETLCEVAGDKEILFFDTTVFGDPDLYPEHDPYDRTIDLNGAIVTGRHFFEMIYPDNYSTNHCLAIYKTDFLKSNDLFFPEGLLYEDNYFTFACLMKADRVSFLDSKLHFRRYRPGSTVTGGQSRAKLHDQIDITSLIYQFIEDNDLASDSVCLRYSLDLCNLIAGRMIDNEALLDDSLREQFLSLPVRIGGGIIERGSADSIIPYLCLFLLCSRLKQTLYRESSEVQRLHDAVRTDVETFYRSIMEQSGLNDPHLRIGIYGTGQYASAMIRTYEALFGQIQAQVYYIDSFKVGESFMGQTVIGPDDVASDFDRIIIATVRDRGSIRDMITRKAPVTKIVDFFDLVPVSLFPSYIELD